MVAAWFSPLPEALSTRTVLHDKSQGMIIFQASRQVFEWPSRDAPELGMRLARSGSSVRPGTGTSLPVKMTPIHPGRKYEELPLRVCIWESKRTHEGWSLRKSNQGERAAHRESALRVAEPLRGRHACGPWLCGAGRSAGALWARQLRVHLQKKRFQKTALLPLCRRFLSPTAI